MISVIFVDDGTQILILRELLGSEQELLDLIERNRIRTVDIKALESCLKFGFGKDFTLVHGGHEPFRVTDNSIVISVSHVKKVVYFFLFEVLSVDLSVTFNKFLF